MKVTFSWIIYSILILGSGILSDGKFERRPAVSACSEITDDKFYCLNGLCIEWSLLCDGHYDCSDGSDETKEVCSSYEFGTNMTMDCGSVNNGNELMVIRDIAINGRVPWSVGIRRLNKTNSNYDLICGASIIAPNIVISAAKCFWEKVTLYKQTSMNDGEYKISVPLITENGINENLINVEMIYLREDYYETVWSTSSDLSFIAVIVLAKKISFSTGIAPVCMDWNSKYIVHSGTIGQIVGIDENMQMVIQGFEYLDQSSTVCQLLYYTIQVMVYSYNKICTSFNMYTDSKIQNSYKINGAGISVLHSNSYFLRGVTSNWMTALGREGFVFTDIQDYVHWIRGILNKHIVGNSCILPTVEGVVYSYEGSNEILPHGTLVNHHITVIENCEDGYHKAYRNSFRVCQGKRKWASNSDKLCFKMCPPLLSDTLVIKCTLNGEKANCSNASIRDTIAIPSCKPSYVAPYGHDTPIKLVCQYNGLWNQQLYKCNPRCGQVYIESQVLLGHAENALIGTAPWNAGVYRLETNNNNYELICGGSIISSNLVVSAAHCFSKKGMLSNRILVNGGLYKIAVGKYDRNFTIIDNEFTEIINVDSIYLNENYYGASGLYAFDIAIIVLRNNISFSTGVAPICIDWNGDYNDYVVNGIQGKIVGWGKTEKQVLSSYLLETSLPYIDNKSCRKKYTNGFDLYLTYDKFCAGSELRHGVRSGDSGAGLCFLHSKSYYLTGIVSNKDPHTNNSIAVFTEVKPHIKWIRELYDKYN